MKSNRKIHPAIFFFLTGLLLCGSVFPDVELLDGSIIKGRIISETDTTVVLETILGEQTVPRNKIKTRNPADTGDQAQNPAGEADGMGHGAYLRDPHRQGLVFIPTAFVPPKHTWYFKDFELLFLTLGFTATSMTAFNIGVLFPVSSEFQILTLGFKQQLFVSKDQSRALAITGAYTQPLTELDDFTSYGVVQAVASFCSDQGSGLHLSAGVKAISTVEYVFSRSGGSPYYYGIPEKRDVVYKRLALGAGLETLMTRHSKFIVEMFNHGPFFDDTEDTKFISLGFRFFGYNLSADIAGMRPIGENLTGLLLWPFVNIGYRFGRNGPR